MCQLAGGQAGGGSFQLILDNGAKEEHIVRPTPSDAKVLLKLIGSNDSIFFGLDRKVFIPHSKSRPSPEGGEV